MAENPLAKYLAALEALERAEHEAERIVSIITDAATRLRNWKQVRITDVSVFFPTEATATRSSEINGRTWPSGVQLAEALSQYHAALREVGTAFRRIPADQRGVVQPPPEH
jgi:hypothetical protein